MAKFQPAGWHSVTPRIIVVDPLGLITFIKQIFDTRGEYRPGRPAEIRIGDSVELVSRIWIWRISDSSQYRPSEDVHQQPPIRVGICELPAMKAHEKQLVRR
jgi:hypothetical protein